MNKHEHTIFGFVGQSGSGKSTLILKLIELIPHLQIVKSTSTRSRRDRTDDLFYDLVSDAEFLQKINNNEFINYHKYNDYWYGTNLISTQETLKSHCGIFAVIESSVETIRSAGFDLKLIKIIPDTDKDLVRSLERKKIDETRAAIPLDFDLTIVNSFQPGGLEKSINEFLTYFEKVVPSEAQIPVK